MIHLTKWIIVFLIGIFCEHLASSQSIKLKRTFWIESVKNIELRKNNGTGFLYPYNLPDAHGEALALFRSYQTPVNNGFSIVELSDLDKIPKALKDRFKFSGSDIDQTNDTLVIAAFYSRTKDASVISGLNERRISPYAAVLTLSEPMPQFEFFRLDLSKAMTKEEKF
ncbi:hypothetical protein [Costertonia aggregata]|uniref:Uncharacterized protein n=1 Tax=Costertonia aggregata TaxID=343403 RepID=A0A7H9ALT3_9FLAO|nr:hypothetical protein [Costertonia aggregata]QLG44377.1 hypothetical protein HYG79_03125 [Costertonia aggregata]